MARMNIIGGTIKKRETQRIRIDVSLILINYQNPEIHNHVYIYTDFILNFTHSQSNGFLGKKPISNFCFNLCILNRT
ncbi:hypothetical protein Hanom_Chr09g00777361 [Helianthus anomalus]